MCICKFTTCTYCASAIHLGLPQYGFPQLSLQQLSLQLLSLQLLGLQLLDLQQLSLQLIDLQLNGKNRQFLVDFPPPEELYRTTIGVGQ